MKDMTNASSEVVRGRNRGDAAHLFSMLTPMADPRHRAAARRLPTPGHTKSASLFASEANRRACAQIVASGKEERRDRSVEYL